MNKHRLQAELWETQWWLMGILAFLLQRFGGFVAHVLAYLILAHMVLTAVGIIVKLLKAKWEDDHNF